MQPAHKVGAVILSFLLCLLFIADKATAHLTDDGVPPLPNGKATTDTFRFAVLGDAGTGKAGQIAIANRLTQFLTERPFDTILMLGDNIYSGGKASDIGPKFEQPYAELLRQNVRFYAILGNHDVRNGREFETKYSNFNMGGRSYYTLAKADDLIEFFALDSTNFNDQQLGWLESALSVSKARWKVAFFHHPLYSSGKSHGSDPRLRSKMEPLLIKYGVSVVLSGHDHFYERIKPQHGVLYFVCGAGGQLRSNGIDRHSALTEASNDKVHSFLFAEATKKNLNFWAIDDTGNVLDGVSLQISERQQ
ncbi:MAG: metallophosphoesterase [Acidobacteria bacterium]|nr:metallophosphoesterase [Acidobacteriota bacterium]